MELSPSQTLQALEESWKEKQFKNIKIFDLLGVVDCDPCSGFPGELVVHVVALEDVNPVKKKYKRFGMMYEGRTSFEQHLI